MRATVLLIGSGGREHALAWSLAQSPQVKTIFCAPGNAAAHSGGKLAPWGGELRRWDEVAAEALRRGVDLTVVGPEAPLCQGIVDLFQKKGLSIFGPDAFCSQLEGSKAFTKELCRKSGIPTADYEICHAWDRAQAAIARFSLPIVIKADGLASGKGVLICSTRQEALQAASDLLEKKILGPAGATVVVEEYLRGIEASFMALVQGERYALLPTSKDHKRLFDGDEGPNTGGMGAISPSSDLTPRTIERAETEILQPLLHFLAKENHPYHGVMYCGLMLTSDGPKLLEINARLGDPETQAILPRIKDDLFPIFQAIADGEWHPCPLTIRPLASLCLVLASQGYPQQPQTGQEIAGLSPMEDEHCLVFQAGTAWRDGRTFVNGGRVLGVTALAPTLAEAKALAYERAERITYPGKICRRDIGARETQP